MCAYPKNCFIISPIDKLRVELEVVAGARLENVHKRQMMVIAHVFEDSLSFLPTKMF